ncbi:MAG: MMPL family transporter [Pseudomonadota bacterium]
MSIESSTIFLLKNPKYSFIAWSIILLLTIPGVLHLWIDTDYKNHFAKTDPQLKHLKEMETYFPSNDSLLIAVNSKSKDIFTAKNLKAINELTQALSFLPNFQHVSSLTNYNYIENKHDEISITQPLANSKNLSLKEIQAFKAMFLKGSNLKSKLISEDTKSTLIFITFSLPDQASTELRDIYDKSNDLLDYFRMSNPQLNFYLSGSIAFNETAIDAVKTDLLTLIPISYLLISIIIFLFVGNFYSLLLVYIIITFSILISLGLKGWFYPSLTSNDALAPTAIMIIAVSDFVHLFDSFIHQRKACSNSQTALEKSIHINLKPIMMTNVTTVIGMLCLNFNESPTIAAFGNLVAVGVLMAMLLTLTLAPILMMYLPVPKKQPIAVRFVNSFFRRLIHFLTHKHPVKNSILVLLMITACFGMGFNTWQDEITKSFDESYPFRQANDFINENITGLHQIDFAVMTPEERGILQPDFFNLIEEFESWLKDQDKVIHVDSVLTPIKRIHELMSDELNEEKISWQSLLKNSAAISQYLLVYELSLPPGTSIQNQITQSWNGIRIQVRLKETNTASILAFEKDARAWFTQYTSRYYLNKNSIGKQPLTPPQVKLNVAGVDLMFSHIVQNNIHGFMVGTFTGFIIMSLLIMILLKSPILGLLAMASSLWPMLIGYGIWGFWNGQLGLSAAAVGAVSLGLVVDDTIHLLHRFMHHLRESTERSSTIIKEAILKSVQEVGPAMLTTGLIFSLGFSVLVFSHYIPTQIFGSLTSITLIAAIIVDLFLIPKLIINLAALTENGVLRKIWN